VTVPVLANSTTTNFALTFLTSVLTSSFVSSAVFYWLTSRKELSQFRRGKLEELFMAYQAYCKMVITIRYLPYRQAMVGQIDYNQALDLAIGAQQKDSPRYHETCEMVIRLYFEEFLPAWDELIKRLDKMHSVQMDFKQSYKEGEDTRRFVIPFDIACREFEKQEEVLRDSIISKARKLVPSSRPRIGRLWR
jgi:hypothetical protein